MYSALKYELIEKIVQTNDQELLGRVKFLLEGGETQNWDDLDPALKAALKRGLKQADNGELTPHEEVMAHIKEKYLKKPASKSSKKS
jgi:hypothetical protein